MKKKLLIVGLGNPGVQYEFTRHNFGFLTIDSFCKTKRIEFQNNKTHSIVELVTESHKLILLKPLEFMNCSGKIVKKISKMNEIKPEATIIIHDEIDFGFGTVKLKFNGGHGGHNGIRSIIDELGFNNFWRLRCGVGRPAYSNDVANYVLGSFTLEERMNLPKIIQNCLDKLLDWIQQQK